MGDPAAGAVVLARRWVRQGRFTTPVALALAALPIDEFIAALDKVWKNCYRALVPGGYGGIGAAIARGLCEAGARVVQRAGLGVPCVHGASSAV